MLLPNEPPCTHCALSMVETKRVVTMKSSFFMGANFGRDEYVATVHGNGTCVRGHRLNGPMRYTRMNARRLGGGYSFTPQFAGTRRTNRNYPRFVLPTMRRTITALALLFFVPFVSYAQQENSTAPPAVEPIVPAVIDLSPACLLYTSPSPRD